MAGCVMMVGEGCCTLQYVCVRVRESIFT